MRTKTPQVRISEDIYQELEKLSKADQRSITVYVDILLRVALGMAKNSSE